MGLGKFSPHVGNDVPEPPASEGGGNFGPMRFSVPMPDKNPISSGDKATKRVLFLDNEPTCAYEHGLFGLQNQAPWYQCLCLKENGISEKGCLLCGHENTKGKKLYPSYVGFYTVIDLGLVEWEGRKSKLVATPGKSEGVSYQFDKMVLTAKRGGKKKPGILMKLISKAERQGGGLAGTVWDTTREGDMSEGCGNDWEFVERVAPKDYVRYLKELGMSEEQHEKIEKAGGLEQFNYVDDVFVIPTYEELQRLTATGQQSFGGQGGGNSQGGFQGTGENDY